MSHELPIRNRDYSNVVRQQYLVSSSAAKFQKFGEQNAIQGSTELRSGAVVLHQPIDFSQWITAGTATPSLAFLFANKVVVQFTSRSTLVEDNLTSVLESMLFSLDRSYTKKLVERIEFLAEPSADMREPTLSLGSLKQFYSFIKSHRFKLPEIVLSFAGNLRAEWRQDRAHYFAAEFLPDGMVKFVVFVQSPINHNKIERTSGTPSLGRLRAIMAITGAKWCFE
jgi:hypothetical protein